MAFYVLGTAISDPDEKTALAVATQNAAHIAPYCREGIEIAFRNSSAGARDAVFRFPALTEGWVSFYMYYGDTTASNWDHDLWAIADYVTLEPMIALRKQLNSTAFVMRHQSSGTLISPATSAPPTGLGRYDIYFKSAASGGVFEVYVNGTLSFSFYGNTTGTGAGNTADALIFRREGGNSSEKRVMSAVIVSSADTRNLHFCVDYPNGDGAVTDWLGSFADVDDVGAPDGASISGLGNGDISTFLFPNLPAGVAGMTPQAVDVRCSGGAVSGLVRAVSRVAGVNYDEGVTLSPSVKPTSLNALSEVNPATGLPWTVSEINAAEFGVKAATS